MPRRTPLFFESNLRRALVVLSTKILLLLLLLLEEEEAFTDDDDDDDARENDAIKAHADIAKKKAFLLNALFLLLSRCWSLPSLHLSA